ncbi:hypothetical protein MTYP_01377 [Methylophilaceae bacterium]|nr:hypothetical protein MTYP_01377 [Methylophilaceae bacterium]
MTQRNAVIAAGIVLLLGVVAGFLYFPRNTENAEPLQIDCSDIVQGCGTGALNIRADRPPGIMRPFELRVQTENAEAVHVSFAMQGMEMGLNRYRMLSQGKGEWIAEVTLPVCARGRIDWLMQVEVRRGQASNVYVLGFTSE